jgi:signal transduction histidine kinase
MLDPSNYTFNFHAFPLFVIGISTLALGCLAYFSNKAASANRHFLILCISISVWLCATAMGLLCTRSDLAFRWFKVDNLGVMFISVAFYGFTVEFLELKRPYSIRLGYVLATILGLVILFTDRFVTGVYVYWWGYYPKWGSYSLPFFVVFFSYMAAAFSCYFSSFRKITSPIKRNQIRYVLVAFLIAYTGSVDFLPVFGYAVYPFGYIPIFLLISVIAIAILRYRLMDIAVVIHKGLVYTILLGLIFLPAYVAILISHRASPYSVSSLISATVVFACGLWIMLRNPKAVTNRTFGLICLAVCVWLFGIFMMYSAERGAEIVFWGKFAYAGVVFIPAFFYHFCVSFLERDAGRIRVTSVYLVSTIFLALLPTDYITNGYYTHFWGAYLKAGPLLPVFLAFFAFISGLSLNKLYLGYKARKQSAPLEATRIQYVFWAFVIGYIASVDFTQNYGIKFYPIGHVFAAFWVIIVTYAIVKYQLLDIAQITRTQFLPYLQIFALIPSYFVILGLIRLFTGTMQFILAGILLATFAVLAEVLVAIQKRVEKVVERTLFRRKYDAYETLTEFSKALVAILDLQDLNEKIIGTLSRVLGIEKISLFLLDKEKDQYFLAASRGLNDERLKDAKIGRLAQYLRETEEFVLKEELERMQSGSMVGRGLGNTMALIEAELSLPLRNKDRMIGVLNLGSKARREMYSQDDLHLLLTLAQNAAIALDNALLYEDLRKQKSLIRRTDRLRSLETIAGGFAHEIRNPLTSIKTFVQLTPQRKDDPEFVGHFSRIVCEDVARIERLIQEILDYAKYMEPKFMREDLNDVVSSCLYFIQVNADRNAVTIEKDFASTLPPVMLDRQQIKQVLLNLFMNALHAMGAEGGRLTVKTHQLVKRDGAKWVQIEVSDTGCGIPARDLDHIFDPFYTTKHESEDREGTGLGLTIVHQIVHEHGGVIEVQSEVGRGTTFFVNLPVQARRPEREEEVKKPTLASDKRGE